MGLGLTRAAQWTTSSAETGTLALTPLNETLLTEILHLVEDFSSQDPLHGFVEPLQWTTALVASDFQTGYEVSDSIVQSQEKDAEGRSLLQLLPPTVYVRSFLHLSKLLHLASDKLGEVRACLEENRNAASKIVGSRFAAILEADDVEELEKVKEEQQGKDSGAKAELLLLRNLDKQLLSKVLQQISENICLYPSEVENGVEVLQWLSGEGKNTLLKSLRHTLDFVFANGCRAPPHRQLLGEMCYLVVEPLDTETLYVTCSNSGVFLNKGVKQYEEEENKYEQMSDKYEDLSTFLKSKSHHFTENIHRPDEMQMWNRPNCKKFKPRITWREILSVDSKMEEKRFSKSSGEKTSGKQEEKKPETGAKSKIKVDLMASSLPGHRSSQKNKTREKRFSTSSGEKRSGKQEKKKPETEAKSKIKADFSASFFPGHHSSQKSKTPARAMPKETLSESSPESEEEEERRPENNTELHSEYWRMQKLCKYLLEGDQMVTVLSMCALMELDLTQESRQLALRDLGGLKVLVNILDTKEIRCIIGSLKILRTVSHNVQIQRSIVEMQGVQSLVPLLDIPEQELKALAAETIANVTRFRKARRTVRHCGGIEKLVKLLDCVPNSPNLTPKQELDVEVARCGVQALWSCSKSTRNKEAIRKAGGIPLLGRLLKSPHVNMLIPVIGTLQECASEESYKNAIRSEGMIKDLVKNLSSSNNDELQMHSASVIFKCAEDGKTRDLIYQYKGLQRLTLLLSKVDNKQLLAAATGAIWKCSLSQKNVTKFQEYGVLEKLVELMADQPDEVLVNVVGALGEFAQIPANKSIIRQCGGIPQLVNLLMGDCQALLVNVTKTMAVCATDKQSLAIIDQLEGLRLVWSLLKNPSPDVQASAAWALCPIIENAKDAAETARCLIGGFHLIIELLKSTNNEVLASICAVVAKIAKDKQNLALLTDYGVVHLLANLTNTTDDRLRRHLADTIACCCMWGKNRAAFGEAGAVAPLVRYVKSNNSAVHETTVVALYQLSKDIDNCITLHSNGVVKPLIELMGAKDENVAYMAAGCVRNIRMLANANKNAGL